MSASNIPEKLTAYNVYRAGNKLVGVDAEVELPNFEPTTSTISGAGIMGEIESPNIGHFGSMELSIPFRTISEEASRLMEPERQEITLRADQQSYDVTGGVKRHRPLKVVVAGMPKGFSPGKLAAGNGTETQVTLEVEYIKIENDGSTLLELDKFNNIYVVNGLDYYEAIRNNI